MSGKSSYNDLFTVGDDLYRVWYGGDGAVPDASPYTVIMAPTATSGRQESQFVMAYLDYIESDVCTVIFTYSSGNLFLTQMNVNDASGSAFRTVSFLHGSWLPGTSRSEERRVGTEGVS